MGRSFILAALLALAPGLAPAAVVSSFSVQSAARLTLTGATFVTGGDALASLDLDHVLDQFDDFPQESGNADVDTSFSRDDTAGAVSAAAAGSASTPFGSATARVHGRLVQIITNTSDTAIDLIFDYAGSVLGTSVDGDIAGAAFVELQDFFGQVFLEEIPFSAIPPQSFSGQTTLTVGAGETVFATAYAEVFGDAFAFGVIPLPATLPLLLGALGGLAAWGGRRRA